MFVYFTCITHQPNEQGAKARMYQKDLLAQLIHLLSPQALLVVSPIMVLSCTFASAPCKQTVILPSWLHHGQTEHEFRIACLVFPFWR